MRLLPIRTNHVRFGAVGEQTAPDGCRYRRRDVREHLPVRNLFAHSRSHQAGRPIFRTKRLTVNLDRTGSGPTESPDHRHRETRISRRAALALAAAGLSAPLLPMFSFAQTRKESSAMSFINVGQ